MDLLAKRFFRLAQRLPSFGVEVGVLLFFTIGYEKLSIEAFISKLKSKAVEVVVDVRELPISRKKGFSKSSLTRFTEEAGMKYAHFKQLGAPTAIRKRLLCDYDYTSFFKEYYRHLQNQQEHLERLEEMIRKFVCCLMCFERDYRKCHRKILAEELQKRNGNNLFVEHLI